MSSLAQLGVKISSGEAKQGATEIKQELKGIGAEARTMATTVAAANKAVVDSMEAEVRAHQRVVAAANRTERQERALAQAKQAQAQAARKAAEDAQRAADQQARAAERVAAAEEAKRRALAAAEEQAYRMDATMRKAATGFGLGETGSNRLRASLTGLLSPILQTTGSANVLVSTLGSLAIGNATTVGILAGIAAIGLAWDVVTSGAREARKETDAAIASAQKLRAEERNGPLGDLPGQLRKLNKEKADAQQVLAEARRNLAELNNSPSYGGAKVGVNVDNTAAIERAAARVREAEENVAASSRKLVQIQKDTDREFSESAERSLIALVNANKEKAADNDALLNRLKNHKNELAKLEASGADPAARAQEAEKIAAIEAAYAARSKAAKKEQSEADRAEAKALAEFNRQRLEAAQIIARVEANELQADRKHAEALERGREAIAAQMQARQRDTDVMREQIEQLKGNANAYDTLAEARAAEKAVAEARRQLPKDETLDPETEAKIRAQVKDWYEIARALKFAKDQRAALDQWNGKSPLNLKESIDSAKVWEDSLRDVTSTLRELSGALNGTGSDAVKMLGAVAAGVEGLIRAQKRADEMRKNGQTVSTGQAVATAAGGAVGAFGAGYAVGSGTTDRTTGALGGAAAGALTGAAAGSVIPGVGTAIGAAVGGLIGGVGGLLGSSKNATQQLIAQREAQVQLTASLVSMRAQMSGDTLGAAIAQTTAQFSQLRKETESAYSGKKNEAERNRILAELNQLETARIAILQQQYAQNLALATADLNARAAAAAGRNDEAAAMRDQASAQREINQAIETYGKDSAYVEQLRAVTAAELAAAEAARQLAAAEKAREQALQREAFSLDLTARRQSLNGDDRGALITRTTIGNNSALAQAEALVKAGTITAEMFEELKRILGDEMVRTIADFDNALANAKQQQQDELAVRTLVAQGRSVEAESMRVEIANRNELAGITDEVLRQQILQVQQLEAEARARAEATALVQKIADQNADIDRRRLDALQQLDPAKAAVLEVTLREADRAKELAAAADESVRARYRELYAMQDAASAQAKLTAELERQKAAAEALANFSSSVDVDYLRATGRTFEADARQLQDDRDRRIKEAGDLGATQDTIDKINAIFETKYSALIAAQLGANTPAAVRDGTSYGAALSSDRAASDITLGGDSTSFRSAQTVTESSAMRLIDYAAAQTALLRRLVQLAEGGQVAQGGSLLGSLTDAIDRQLGLRSDTYRTLVSGTIA